MIRFASLTLTAVLAAGMAWGQSVPVSRPYAGMQDRPIKALSEQQVADLRAGRGMSMALPAELNGYPGPMHTLENADVLSLSPDQRSRTKALFEMMRAEAILIGERLIRQEAELENLFATQVVQPASLETATAAIGATQGQLRATHLRYHLAMMDVLTLEQVRRYGEARGYGGGDTFGHTSDAREHGHGAHRP